ncbi:MAG: tyrosine-protein phosphatase [Lishizhenia sp.]
MINSIFKKRKKIDLSELITDVHSHLIPGIDDGAQTLDHSIGMLLKFQELGYKKVITTPHILSDLYPNTPETILNGYNIVKEELERINLNIEFQTAAEYFYDDHLMAEIESNQVMKFNQNYVLFEFSFNTEPLHVDELIFKIQSKGLIPVLAHYERYSFYMGNIKMAQELKEKGVKIQMNLNSLTGHYGSGIRKTAELLIKNKLVDLAGTDCHRIEHLHLLERNLEKPFFHKLLDLDLLNRKL